MVICSASGCTNSDRDGYVMKRFPLNPNKRNVWLSKINRKNWKPTKLSAICEAHFEKSMWMQRDGKLLLKPTAIPTIFKTLASHDKERTTNDETDHNYAFVQKITNSPDLLRRRIAIHEKRYMKLFQRNRYYKIKLKVTNRKVKALESKLDASNDEYFLLMKSVFNSDQIEAMKRKSSRFMKWSEATLTRALKLRYTCGEAGYEELLTQRFPLPSLRTLRRYIELLNVNDEVVKVEQDDS